jgi:hypothetical protein
MFWKEKECKDLSLLGKRQPLGVGAVDDIYYCMRIGIITSPIGPNVSLNMQQKTKVRTPAKIMTQIESIRQAYLSSQVPDGEFYFVEVYILDIETYGRCCSPNLGNEKRSASPTEQVPKRRQACHMPT